MNDPETEKAQVAKLAAILMAAGLHAQLAIAAKNPNPVTIDFLPVRKFYVKQALDLAEEVTRQWNARYTQEPR